MGISENEIKIGNHWR